MQAGTLQESFITLLELENYTERLLFTCSSYPSSSNISPTSNSTCCLTIYTAAVIYYAASSQKAKLLSAFHNDRFFSSTTFISTSSAHGMVWRELHDYLHQPFRIICFSAVSTLE